MNKETILPTNNVYEKLEDTFIYKNGEDSNSVKDCQQYKFNINCLSKFDIKYKFQEKLKDLKFRNANYKEHFTNPCFRCSSSFHCSNFEDGHFNLEKMLINGIKCSLCRRNLTKERSFYHCCNICNASFKNCKLLFKHRRNEHPLKTPIQCVVCHLSLAHGGLSNHLKKHKRPHKCPYCNKRYGARNKLELHIVRCNPSSEKKFKCKLCPKEFYDKYRFEEHQVFHAKLFACKLCEKCFTSRDRLKSHSYIHSGDWPYNCSFCSKGFARSFDLKRHEYFRICTDNPRRDFKCNACTKKFNTEKALSNHKLWHAGVKPFSCKYCPKQYKSKRSLDIHLFEHTGGKQFKCDLCNKTFAQLYLLNRHKFIHMEKSFQCNQCPKQYTSKRYLDIHLFEHNGGKQFKCDLCDKTFATQHKLNIHKTTHMERSFQCTICSNLYKSSGYLRVHIKRAHTLLEYE